MNPKDALLLKLGLLPRGSSRETLGDAKSSLALVTALIVLISYRDSRPVKSSSSASLNSFSSKTV